ncbi:MAG TPA: hypothetical protein VE197_10340, partial [Mycobacterium sp.]|nr:hypothetical protein [Mycobacterium sp.]
MKDSAKPAHTAIIPLTRQCGPPRELGLWWSATVAAHVGYESWLERDWLMAFDSSCDVIGIASQPFWLSWQAGSSTKQHASDFFLRRADGAVAMFL